MMDYMTFLTHIINDGIEAVKVDYAERPKWLSGALLGFEMCRGKTPEDLVVLLTKVSNEVNDAFKNDLATEPYWEVKCKQAEVEWVCNCISALRYLSHTHQMTVKFFIIPPTSRGVLKAAEVLRRTN